MRFSCPSYSEEAYNVKLSVKLIIVIISLVISQIDYSYRRKFLLCFIRFVCS